ncbi:larval serum protein 1 alpha chain [Drosophila innubila]|uniref:larval serum protein 1 alpha chain n=1 Tax=Drosophila innubila TaxID=198719 RepID=UPI00148D1942|nr:larval serum protein 1 alpha chain [Drosophila innubila]
MLGLTLALVGALSSLYGINGWILRPRWRSAESFQDVVTSQWELRQRFLLDLMLQVHKPLLQQELIEMGRQLNENPNDYEEGSWPLLLDFMDDVHQGRMLRPYSIYSQLQEDLPQQLLGVYRFLKLAKDWKTFQRNACYARIRFNSVLFVNALQLAIEERSDAKDLMLPAMHEVLPQLYFDREVILEAQRVNWQQLAPVPKISNKHGWRETLGSFVYPKMLRQSSLEVELVPADPMVIEVEPLETQLSLDVELNGYWSRLLSRLMISAKDSASDDHNERIFRGNPNISIDHLVLMHNIKQFVALFQLEELSTGTRSLQLIEPTLLTTGGVPYKATGLSAEAVRQLISESIEELRIQIDKELTEANNVQAMWMVGQVISTQYWQICRHLSQAINGNHVEPNLMGMATFNLRDPIYRLLLFQFADLIAQYEPRIKATSHQRQHLQLRHIRVGQLETYDELEDTDLINLMDQQLLQTQRNNLQLLRRRLVARQLRLNHKPFNITYELFATAPIAVLIRSYLLPPGGINIQHRLLIDSFVSHLTAGEQQLERHFPTAPNGYTLSDLYEAKHPLNAFKFSSCSFPKHLLLPRGTADGLKLNLLVQISLWTSSDFRSSECEWSASVEDWTAHNVVDALLDVKVQHHNINPIEKDTGQIIIFIRKIT